MEKTIGLPPDVKDLPTIESLRQSYRMVWSLKKSIMDQQYTTKSFNLLELSNLPIEILKLQKSIVSYIKIHPDLTNKELSELAEISDYCLDVSVFFAEHDEISLHLEDDPAD